MPRDYPEGRAMDTNRGRKTETVQYPSQADVVQDSEPDTHKGGDLTVEPNHTEKCSNTRHHINPRVLVRTFYCAEEPTTAQEHFSTKCNYSKQKDTAKGTISNTELFL